MIVGNDYLSIASEHIWQKIEEKNLPVHGIEHCFHALQAPVIKLLATRLVGREGRKMVKCGTFGCFYVVMHGDLYHILARGCIISDS